MPASTTSAPSIDAAVPDELVVSSFGVKHGDCTLVEYVRNGIVNFRLLCDGGVAAPGALFTHLANQAHEQGAGYIDVVVLTHVDQDHQGGLPAVFNDQRVRVGEFWGPCLPAFKRLRWLFQKPVFDGIERAGHLEQLVQAKGVPVLYPLEGHIRTTPDRRVTVSVISPAPRLIRELAYGGDVAIRTLVTNAPLPLEWLITGAALDERREDADGGPPSFNARTQLAPEDFPRPLAELKFATPDRLEAESVARGSEAAEPDFFGNHVLNDTSLVLAIDVLLDGKRRRRVVLTGDQVNWAYIASRYPTGLGVDILKVPHHGGKVFLADKQEEDAIEQLYLWLRPRVAMVSAMGHHKLPHVRTREALRRAGTTLFCPNTRGYEPLDPDAMLTASPCCFDAYGCRQKTATQTAVVTVRLTGESAGSQVPACLQGTLHQGPAPIVVQTQRIVEPDETFIRWTRTEIERQAQWLRRCLQERHAEFQKKFDASASPCALIVGHTGVPWRDMETKTRAKGHLHLAADPEPVLRYAIAAGHILWDERNRWRPSEGSFYLPPSDTALNAARAWVKSIRHLVFTIPDCDGQKVGSGNGLALLDDCDLGWLSLALSFKLRLPKSFVDFAVMPKVKLDLIASFDARVCNASWPGDGFRDGADSILHLSRDPSAVPDIFDATWTDRYWGASDQAERLAFVIDKATDGVLLVIHPPRYEGDGRERLGRLAPPGPRSYEAAWEPGHFPDAFGRAKWTSVWQRVV